MNKRALVIGITGGFGGATALALQTDGWDLRALNRGPVAARAAHPELAPVEWVRGDAMDPEAVSRAAQGVDVIIHAANPAGYKNWRGLAIPMLKNSIKAARENGARLVFPGNVYNFGTDAFPLVSESSPQNPSTAKGAVRVEMEAMLETASRQGTGVLILRAGDFFGATAQGSWLSGAMVKPGVPIRSVIYPGAHEVGHAWAYLPDLAETVARLLDREAQLGEFEVFHFAGHYLERGVEMADKILAVAGVESGRVRTMPWWLLRVASPFVTLFRELLEMRYLWNEAAELDNRKLLRFLGQEPRTPIDLALRRTLVGMGCLADPDTASAPPSVAALL